MRLASTGWVTAELKLFLSTLTSASVMGLAVTVQARPLGVWPGCPRATIGKMTGGYVRLVLNWMGDH